MHNSLFILDFFSHVLFCCKYVYLDRDIDVYWYYYDNSNKRNDDSDGDGDCGDVNILVGTRQK